ncbi:MAG: hypothetical protein GWP08_10865 [Nitrospiraceae bacterium]|nr:hypothetical protein [Nitrospiraceae bacterium]
MMALTACPNRNRTQGVRAYFSHAFPCFVAAGLVLLWCVPACAQLRSHDAQAQVRDAIVDSAEGTLLVPVYDRNRIWKLDPATGRIITKATVGRGPVAIALAPKGDVLACANNLDGTVTLLRVADLGILTTIDCDKGPTALAALPDGRFAVVCGFSDSVAIIDPAAPGRTAKLDGVGAVPTDADADAALLAVATRVPPALQFFSADTLAPAGAVALPDAPRAVAALGQGGRFAVALATRIVLVDGPARKIVAERAIAATALSASDGNLAALTGDAVLTLSSSLEPIASTEWPQPGVALCVTDGFVVAASPQTKQFHTYGTPPRLRLSSEAPQAAAEPPKPSAPGALVETEAQPLDAPPAQEPLTPSAEPKPVAATPEPKPSGETKKAEDDTAIEEKPEQPEIHTHSTYRPQPQPHRLGSAPRAQRKRRPSASPMIGVGQTSVNEALAERIGFDPEQSFQPIDWTQPWRDTEADEFDMPLEGGEMRFKGNVRTHLDTIDFAADELWYNEETGEMRAEGNVIIAQDPSILTADSLYYRVPAESEMTRGLILEPYMTKQERAKLRFSSGFLEATNTRIVQPTQELRAGRLRYNLADGTGEIEDAFGRATVYYFSAKKLTLRGPGDADLEDLWVSTSDRESPEYKILLKRLQVRDRRAVYATGAQLQLGKFKTPFYWPRWGFKSDREGTPISFDFDSGRRAEIGYYVNIGQQWRVSRDVILGLRLLPTSREGIGVGFEAEYDFSETPASRLYMGQGTIRTLYTTEGRGHFELYHRHFLDENTRVLLQVEQWYDEDFYKDFYYEQYKDRTAPRTFANATYTKPTYIATGTVRASTHDFTRETERWPEVTFHLLQRPIADNLYLSYDTTAGYLEREPWGSNAVRWVNVARLTYDLKLHEALNITPFFEIDATFYSKERHSDSSDLRFANTAGVTLQTRLHKEYPGSRGFSGFKHIVVPSITYSYRPEPTMGVEETPRFDSYDVANGRSRIETKLDNVLFGRDAETGEVWQVARLSLYQGNDFWNESQKAEDYEAELDLRPRPWWGWLMAAERHSIDDDFDITEPYFFQTAWLRLYERFTGKPFNKGDYLYQYDARFGDYKRLLTYVYYDDTAFDGKFNAHLGFAYTETQDRIFNREILYGGGYRLNENWGIGFEHRYDFERDELAQQKYEIRRKLGSFDGALQFRERSQGWDVSVELSIIAFPGSKLKF